MKEEKTNSWHRISQKGAVFPHQYAFTLLIPFRNIFLSPAKLLARLALQEHYQVLEVGAGPGYFSVPVARALRTGRLVVSDLQPEMLDLAQKRLRRRKIFNVDYHLCNGFDFPFADQQFDLIYLVTVLGEVENKQAYIAEFYRLLRPGGILSISEQAGDPDKMSPAEIENLLCHAGFRLAKLHGTKRNFTINFSKPA